MINDIMKDYINRENVDIHKISFNGYPLYFVHDYSINEVCKTAEAGHVYIIYHDVQNNKLYPRDYPVLTYKLIYTIEGKRFVELENLFIEEAYRGKGLGSILLKYFENKIVIKYFSNIDYVKGVLLIGSENKLRRFYKRNGYEIVDDLIKKRILKT